MKNPAILSRSFYEQKTEEVAKQLLGKIIVRRIGKKNIKEKITETEAYVGVHDLASHSSKGITKRNSVMFGPAGRVYVYLIYGLHHCLNIATEKEGTGSAVLIRGVEKISGPGRVCKFLQIDRNFNGLDITKNGELYILDADPVKNIVSGPRIGVDYAKEWKDKLLRFYY